MRMNDVAERMGVHVSTVSRAVKGKYADFNGNIIAIKDMFLSRQAVRIRMQNLPT